MILFIAGWLAAGVMTVNTLVHIKPLKSELFVTIVLVVLGVLFWPSVLWELLIEPHDEP